MFLAIPIAVLFVAELVLLVEVFVAVDVPVVALLVGVAVAAE